MIISDIDFAAMYRRHVKLSGRTATSAGDWDARAKNLSGNVPDDGSGYTREFIRRMDLSGANTLLDIGCGPGTIALAAAGQLGHVVALDYSPVMLECLRDRARTLGLGNVETCLRSWEDDWSDVPECDIVVASRSSMVSDMAQALAKMTGHARQRCYMTHRAANASEAGGGVPVPGRPHAFPDYIYIVNILYGMGLNPRLDYIELPGKQAVRWAFISWDVPLRD